MKKQTRHQYFSKGGGVNELTSETKNENNKSYKMISDIKCVLEIRVKITKF